MKVSLSRTYPDAAIAPPNGFMAIILLKRLVRTVFRSRQAMSACRGKADMARTVQNFSFDPQLPSGGGQSASALPK